MTNKEVLTMIKKNDECEEFSFTNNIEATYFVDREGNKISFGYDEYLGRLNDHRIIFSFIDDIDWSDFTKLIEVTKLLVYMPESTTHYGLKILSYQKNKKNL